MLFREQEGVTMIVSHQDAHDHNLPFDFRCRMITLNVHSSLEAIGFMAVIASRLAALEMGVNPVSGFYHDHLFVPEGREEQAMQCISDIANEAKLQR